MTARLDDGVLQAGAGKSRFANPARLLHHPLFQPLAALAVLLLVDLAFVPGFCQRPRRAGPLYGNLLDVLNRAAPLSLTAVGMTLVIATRGIDISVGAVVAIAASVAAALVGPDAQNPAVPLPWAFAAALGAALLCGIWNGLLVAAMGLQPIVATLILMVAGRGLAQLITGGQILTVYYQPFHFLGGGYLFGLPFALYVVGALVLVTSLLLRKTALGLFIQAVGINPAASRLAGIRAAVLIFLVYVFCAACAGLAGLIISSNVRSADANNAGLLLELDAILAVTLGGTSLAGGKFSLAGSLVGALIIQTLTSTIYAMGVPPEINIVVKAIVVLAVCLSQ